MNMLIGDHRRHSRTDIRTKVSISMDKSALNTKTHDISESGISLSKNSDLSLSIGQSVNITFSRMPNLTVPAKIVRTSDNNIGLELEHFNFSETDINNIVHAAPFLERIRYLSKRTLWKLTRRTVALAANTIFRQVILRSVKPTFLFAVYGNERDVNTYYTPSMLKLLPPIMIGGIIKNKNHKGMLVASKFLEQELASDSNKVNTYLEQLKSEFPNINTIALVGRLPTFALKAGNEIIPPYVDGSMGTRYMIWDVSRQMRKMPEFINESTICVLGGAGRIGSKVREDLTREFNKVIAFDLRFKEDKKIITPTGTILCTSNPQHLTHSKLYISLTHHGDVITDLMNYIPEGSLIADDTHPCISMNVRKQLNALNIHVKKVILTNDDFSMWPRMPAWNHRDIPGCLVEALVLLDQNDTDVGDFDAFRNTAEASGFGARLIMPLHE